MPRSGSRVRVSFAAPAESQAGLFLLFFSTPYTGGVAQMAELVDACVSGAHAARCAGSSPVLGTRAGGEIGIHATLRG